MQFKHIFKMAVVVAIFTATVSSYGIYRWLSEVRAEVPGVNCYTGVYPALVPVR